MYTKIEHSSIVQKDEMNNIVVSVITSSYNSKRFLRDCIDSVAEQDFPEFEHIVVDCASTDGSLDILTNASHPRLRIVKSDFCGVATARDIGIAHAQGEFIAILDSDDVAFRSRLRKQLEAFRSNPELVAVGSGVVTYDDSRNRSWRHIFPADHYSLSIMMRAGVNPIPHSTLMFRRAAYQQVGGYRDRFQKCEDFDFLLRLSNVGRITTIQETLGRISVRRDSHTHVHKPMGRDAEYYVLLALILTPSLPVEVPNEMPDAENWLDRAGRRAISAIMGRRAMTAISRNIFKLHGGALYMLLRFVVQKMPAVIWWTMLCVFDPSLVKTRSRKAILASLERP